LTIRGLRTAVGSGRRRQARGAEAVHWEGARCGRSDADDRESFSFDEIAAAQKLVNRSEK